MDGKLFDVVNGDVLSFFLDSVEFNYSVIDKNGHYLVQNNKMIDSISRGAVQAADIDLPSWEHCQEVMKLGKKVTKEEQFEGRYYLSIKQPLFDNNQCIGIRVLSFDITARKQKEKELQEAMVAKKAAEAASQAKTRFLENMRHDIRTPLVGIIGFADLIKGEAKDATISQYADNLIASGRTLLEFLNEILDTIKIASGEVPVLKKPFDLKSKVLDVIKLNQAKAHTKHLDLTFSYDDRIAPCLLGDPVRVQRLLLELVTNALNFTTKGYVRVLVSLESSQYSDQMIKLVVSDSGIGIPKEQQEELYVRFNRLSPAYEGIYKGRGLGLSIVKQFMDDLKGEIRVESEPNKGTTFSCLIPLQASLFDECKETPTSASSALTPVLLSESQESKENKKNQRNKKVAQTLPIIPSPTQTSVLLVEDDRLAQQVTKSLLTSLGCEVDIASDGKSAIKAFKANGHELILMDIGLPDMDGYQVTKSMRLLEGRKEPQIPIIALSAHADTEYKKMCIEAGMNAVFNKPLLRDQALDLLQTFVPDRKQQKEQKEKTAATSRQRKVQEKTDLLTLDKTVKVMDLTYLDTNFGKNSKTGLDLIQLFLKSLPEDLDVLTQAYQKRDLEQLRALAHKIKGASLYCGALRLAKFCERLETQVKENEEELAFKLYDLILKEAEAYQKEAKKK